MTLASRDSKPNRVVPSTGCDPSEQFTYKPNSYSVFFVGLRQSYAILDGLKAVFGALAGEFSTARTRVSVSQGSPQNGLR